MDANLDRTPDDGPVDEPPAAAGEDAADVRAILGYFGQDRFPYFEFEPPVFPEPPDDVQPIAETLADAPTSVATDDDRQAAEYLEYVTEGDTPPAEPEDWTLGDDLAAPERPVTSDAGQAEAQVWLRSADGRRSPASKSGGSASSADSGTPLGDLFRRIG